MLGGIGGRWECGETSGETYADDAIWADELDQLVGGGTGGVSLGIGAEVAEVTNVALLVGGGTVVLATGVDLGRKLAWWSVGIAMSGSSGLSFPFPSSFCLFSAFVFSSPPLAQFYATLLSFTFFSSPTIDHLDIEQ